VSAINFARIAINPNGTSNGTPVPSVLSNVASPVTTVARQARQLLRQLPNGPIDYSHDNPTASFVLERTGSGSSAQYVLKPVVLGLTDGVVYEVLAGLSPGENVIIGIGVGGARGTGTPGGRTPPIRIGPGFGGGG